MSPVFENAELHPDHQADLDRSGITPETRRLQKIRTIPPYMIDLVLGFTAPRVRSAYIIPFASPRGGWMDHAKLKVFSEEGTAEVRGDRVEQHRERYRYNSGARKYLVRKAAPPRLYFPLGTISAALEGQEPVWIVEGMKKRLAVAQLGLPAVGIESAWSWHEKGSRALLADFDFITLEGRTVEVVPDGDMATNPSIAASLRRLGDALRAAGAHPRLVRLPEIAARW